jgi:phosphocarrier protein
VSFGALSDITESGHSDTIDSGRTNMAERTVTVASADGLHARPAATFVKAATQSAVPVTIAKIGGGAAVNARSVLAVISLDVNYGDEVVITAEGEGAEPVLDVLAALLSSDVENSNV